MNDDVLYMLQRFNANRWTQRHGHEFHNEADAKCCGEEIAVYDLHEPNVIAFYQCSENLDHTRPGDE